jgi:hypothetical protein
MAEALEQQGTILDHRVLHRLPINHIFRLVDMHTGIEVGDCNHTFVRDRYQYKTEPKYVVQMNQRVRKTLGM